MKIAIIGLGYVGIQLAIAFSREHEVIGFDSNDAKIESYRSGTDQNGEITHEELMQATSILYSSNIADLYNCNIFVIAVPTPVDDENRPDLKALVGASEFVASVLQEGDIVVYESTVYPGATEEVCIPILEKASGLTWLRDFHVGYSPERINPGDPEHNLQTIIKIVAADDAGTLEILSELYASIVPAGIYRASSIRVAEAAKVIENTQRDLNIALVNEFAIIFDKLNLDTTEVLEAAATKWNFLPFRPGLVGGHCIGVDPYYLTYKSQSIGYDPQVILAGRRINDSMGEFVAAKTIELIAEAGIGRDNIVNLLGVTFKENCRDIRNSQTFRLIRQLEENNINVNVADPMADPQAVMSEQGVKLTAIAEMVRTRILIVTVPHQIFPPIHNLVQNLLKKPGLFIDVRSAYKEAVCEMEDLVYWNL